MIDSDILSEDDLALITALQAEPRASWAAVSRVTGLSAATAARHWERLTSSGIAWVTASPGQVTWSAHCVAYVEVTCAAGATVDVAHTLVGDPHALTVEITAGSADLFLTVATTSLDSMSRYLLQRVDKIPGITHTNSRISTGLYHDGAHWRLDALPRRRPASSDPATQTAHHGDPLAHLTDVDRELFVQLGLDGRATYAQLSHRLGISEATARRRTEHLVRTGAISLRAEVAASRVGWPVSAIMSMEVPVSVLGEAARTVARLRQTRLSATLAGRPSLIVVVWLKHIDQIHDLERRLVDAIPGMQVQNRLTVLQTVKRMGRILDADGHAIGVVPMSHWQDPLAPCDGAAAPHRLTGRRPGQSERERIAD